MTKRAAALTAVLLCAALAVSAAEQRQTLRDKIRLSVLKSRLAKAEAKYPALPALEKGATPEGGKTYRRELAAEGGGRYYHIRFPKGYAKESAYPLVLSIHGGAGGPFGEAEDSDMDAASDKYGLITVYPAGTSKLGKTLWLYWNVGDGVTDASVMNTDDTAYFLALLKDVKSLASIDAKRVYSTGISQGGSMSYKLACDPELSKQIAAVAPVAAVLVMPLPECRPSHPMSVIHFHGTADDYTPYKGGAGKHHPNPELSRIGVAETIDFWLNADNLPDEPAATDKKGAAEMKAWGPGKTGAEVRLWTLVGGGHTWPGVPKSGRLKKQGAVNMDINATDLMCEFFLSHPLAQSAEK